MALGSKIKNIMKRDSLLMTPRVELFLQENPEGVVWDDRGFRTFHDLVNRSRGNESREGRFGASSRGTCHRRQVFTFLGMPQVRVNDSNRQNMFNDGKWRHLRWQMMGLQSGALTHAEWPAKAAKYRLKVSMDGLNAREGWLFELKGDRRQSRVLDGNPEGHVLQIHTMFLATGYERAAYIVESKETSEWREIVVEKDPVVMRTVRKELEELNGYVEDRKLPPILPACATKEGPYKSCPYGPECLARHRAVGNQWPGEPGNWAS